MVSSSATPEDGGSPRGGAEAVDLSDDVRVGQALKVSDHLTEALIETVLEHFNFVSIVAACFRPAAVRALKCEIPVLVTGVAPRHWLYQL
jgi:hypothetical protein